MTSKTSYPHICNLIIENIRNLSNIHIEPTDSLNIFFGENGAGKTSLLEAIHLLGLAKSFRTHLLRPFIQSDADNAIVSGKIKTSESGFAQLGYMKNVGGKATFRLNEKDLSSIGEIAKILPLILLDNHRFNIMSDSPKERRHLYDFGMFHVEPNFISLWRTYHSALKQRNALLKSFPDKKLLAPWNQLLHENAWKLYEIQLLCFEKLKLFFELEMEVFMPNIKVELNYHPGWTPQQNFLELLDASFEDDIKKGYTGLGPHRYDIMATIGKQKATDILSRGQLKLLVCALFISIHKIIKTAISYSPIWLIDDLPSELDEVNLEKVLSSILNTKAQTFLTCVTPPRSLALSSTNLKMFHVEHGRVISVKAQNA